MNVPLGLYTHPDCLLHDAGPGNPERPQRLQALTAHLKRTGIWQDLQVLKAQPASAADRQASIAIMLLLHPLC